MGRVCLKLGHSNSVYENGRASSERRGSGHSEQPGSAGRRRLKVKAALTILWTARPEQLTSTDHERDQQGAVMMHDVVGMVLIAVLFVLVVASLAILPGEGGTAPRLPKSRAPRQRRSAAWLSVSSTFKALSPSRS
jgi:hypothetical protein